MRHAERKEEEEGVIEGDSESSTVGGVEVNIGANENVDTNSELEEGAKEAEESTD